MIDVYLIVSVRGTYATQSGRWTNRLEEARLWPTKTAAEAGRVGHKRLGLRLYATADTVSLRSWKRRLAEVLEFEAKV